MERAILVLTVLFLGVTLGILNAAVSLGFDGLALGAIG